MVSLILFVLCIMPFKEHSYVKTVFGDTGLQAPTAARSLVTTCNFVEQISLQHKDDTAERIVAWLSEENDDSESDLD